jgi:hypothetical protein
MNKYIDPNGELCEAFCTEGPSIINTMNGETAAQPGDWIVRRVITGETLVFDNETFCKYFTKGE